MTISSLVNLQELALGSNKLTGNLLDHNHGKNFLAIITLMLSYDANITEFHSVKFIHCTFARIAFIFGIGIVNTI